MTTARVFCDNCGDELGTGPRCEHCLDWQANALPYDADIQHSNLGPGKIIRGPLVKTLRDEFAMAAMPVIIQISLGDKENVSYFANLPDAGIGQMTEAAYAYADAMLEARKADKEAE